MKISSGALRGLLWVVLTALVGMNAACTSMAKSAGMSLISGKLDSNIGQSYNTVIENPRTYGPLIGEEKLAGGFTVKKHLTDRRGKGSIFDMAGGGEPIGVETKMRMATYFKVDSKGIIRDWAAGYIDVGTGFGLAGLSITEIFGVKDRDVYIEEVDQTVKTRDDKPYTVWKTAS
ncbi:MAG TPA: hypothetical protein VGE55_08700 [Limnobacter sp.]|uniref:hypothetical protein n=1 Tax=Limnobacter sp. TaxID=2003368 RepID=UPI002EDA351B